MTTRDELGLGAALYDCAVELVRLRAVVAEQRERISGLLDLGERYARADGAKREALQAIYDLPGGRQDEAWRIAYRALALDAEGVSEPAPERPEPPHRADSPHSPGSLTSPVDTARPARILLAESLTDAEYDYVIEKLGVDGPRRLFGV